MFVRVPAKKPSWACWITASQEEGSGCLSHCCKVHERNMFEIHVQVSYVPGCEYDTSMRHGRNSPKSDCLVDICPGQVRIGQWHQHFATPPLQHSWLRSCQWVRRQAVVWARFACPVSVACFAHECGICRLRQYRRPWRE